MGYLHDPVGTAQSLTPDGYLRTGDIGVLDARGFLYITGRAKELLVTSGGENVAPLLIEDALKERLPCVSNVVVIGNGRKFLTCLVTLKSDWRGLESESVAPTTGLHPLTAKFVADCGSSARTTQEAARCPRVLEAIAQGVAWVNVRAVSRASRVGRVTLLPEDFSMAGGEVTATMKLKRNVIEAKHAAVIEVSGGVCNVSSRHVTDSKRPYTVRGYPPFGAG